MSAGRSEDRAGRWVDLGTRWLEQYAPEIELFEPALAARVRPELGRLEGYLSSTALTFVRVSADPARAGPTVADRDAFVGEQLARVEAEFAGRILRGPADLARLRAEPPDHLTWAIVALDAAGDLLTAGDAGRDRLAGWLRRGVRIVGLDRPGGAGGDDDLPAAALEALGGLTALGDTAGRIGVEVGGLTASEKARWIGAYREGGWGQRGLRVLASRVGWAEDDSEFVRPTDLTPALAAALAAVGQHALIGLATGIGPDALAQAIRRLGVLGFAPGGPGQLGLASGFPDEAPAGPIGTAPGLIAWLEALVGPRKAGLLLRGNALRWVEDLLA